LLEQRGRRQVAQLLKRDAQLGESVRDLRVAVERLALRLCDGENDALEGLGLDGESPFLALCDNSFLA
jgi:hypothetical protein